MKFCSRLSPPRPLSHGLRLRRRRRCTKARWNRPRSRSRLIAVADLITYAVVCRKSNIAQSRFASIATSWTSLIGSFGPENSREAVLPPRSRRCWTGTRCCVSSKFTSRRCCPRAAPSAESWEGGETVSACARRHGLTPQQLFGWRRQARRRREVHAMLYRKRRIEGYVAAHRCSRQASIATRHSREFCRSNC